MESFTATIEGLMISHQNFPQKIKQQLARESSKVINPVKFIAGLLTGGVLKDDSSDSEAVHELKEIMVHSAIKIASAKGADGVGGLLKALEGSGNIALVSALRTWVKENYGVQTDGELSEPTEGASAVVLSPAAKQLPKNEKSPTGIKLLDQFTSCLEDDFTEKLEGHVLGKASEVVQFVEFSTSLVLQNVLEQTGTQLASVPQGQQRQLAEKPIASNGLFVATNNGLISLNLRTLEATALTIEEAFAVAVNQNLSKVYWSQGYPGSCIMRSNFDGSAKEVIVPAADDVILTLAIDEASGNVYFAEYQSHEIKVCNALGEHCTVVLANSALVNFPSSISVNALKRLMYWNNGPHSYRLSLVSAKLDGSNARVISCGFEDLWGICPGQPSNDVIYWADDREGTIGTVDVNGCNKRTLVKLEDDLRPYGLQVDANKIYFSSFRSETVQSVDRDSGAELTTIFNSTTGEVRQLALFSAPVNQS